MRLIGSIEAYANAHYYRFFAWSDSDTHGRLRVRDFVFRPMVPDPASVSLTWQPAPDRLNILPFKHALDEPEWRDVMTNITVNGSTATLRQPIDSNCQRYYRILLQP